MAKQNGAAAPRASALLLLPSLLLSLLAMAPAPCDAAAGYPLVRDDMIFNPLSCNSNLASADCTTTLESIISSSSANDTAVVIPCGTCATLSTADGSVLDLSVPLDIQGKLHVPSTAIATIRTTALFVQGELVIDPPNSQEGLRLQLFGTDDVMFNPHPENADKCSDGMHGNHCNVSSKAVVVAGGKLDIRGDQITTSSQCKAWTTLKDVDTTNPILPSHPECLFDGSLLEPGADGTFESSSKTGFQRYRWGSIKIESEDDGNGGTNTYLHNYGRNNVKDGLQVNLGNHTLCSMRNRMYRMTIKYRLNDISGHHRPKIELDFKDQSPRQIAHLDLPASVDGSWASATFNFLSSSTEQDSFQDIKDHDIANVKVVWPSCHNCTADYDDISILPILHDPPGTPDVFFVDPQVASCWASKVGTELLITSNEIGELRKGWDGEDVATITNVDVATGAITVDEPIAHYKTTEMQDVRFATEVAILHRSTIFEAVDDNAVEPWIGGHSIILHTTVPQVLSGAAFFRFGQQGKLGRYPIHFHMAGDHPDSVVSKNLIRNSQQRCVVIHGTDSVLVEENVAYDTIGHCYINENGVEEGIRFHHNLGALTLKQPEERLIGESDHRAYTFWFSNANVSVVGNVAAGAHMGGYWYETFEHAPHGPYRNTTLWPEYAEFNPKSRPFGSFIDNVVHSSGERGIRMYEPGYKPFEEFTFYNSRVYKNNMHGIFIHGVQYMILDGGVFADNEISVRNFNDRTIFRNVEFMGTSDLVRERHPTLCHSKVGLQQRINAGWNDGSILENCTFTGLNKELDCSERGFEFYHLLQEKMFIGNTHFSNTQMKDGTTRDDLVNIECRWAEEPFNIQNILVEDIDGSLGLTGNPGFYTSDSSIATAFIPDAGTVCIDHPRGCAKYCDGVCLRNVQVTANGYDYTNFHTMRITDLVGGGTFDYQLHIDQSDENKHSYDALLPKGLFEITFLDLNGNVDESIVPSDIQIKLGDKPGCSNHLEESDLNLKTDAPTYAPTTVPPLEPLPSDTIISPIDPILKLGSHDWTNDPAGVISGQIVTYSIYEPDHSLPSFSVRPESQHSCSIVQGLKVYTSPSSSGKDPKRYQIEGRFGIHDEYSLISEGLLNLPGGRNVEGTNVTDALYYSTIAFANNVNVYKDYRVRLFENAGSVWTRVGQVQFTGHFVACDHVMPQPTGSPTSSPSKSPSRSPSTSPTTSNPTASPVAKPTPPPSPPIYASSIIQPGDPIIKLGTSQYTYEPWSAIDGTTEKYYVWKNDWMARPVFSVTPGQASIVQGLKAFRADQKANKNPTSYKIEGRKLPTDEWELISEGALPGLGPKNEPGLSIDDPAVSYGEVTFPNNVAYAEYRLWFPTNGGNCCVMQVAEVQLVGFLVSSTETQLTAPYPGGAVCNTGAECESGLCNGTCE